jgi:WhiB family transcriptional regulator, redox-sensing transcriptional regulator
VNDLDAWRLDAHCIDKPDLFFLSDGQHSDAARAICAGCPVRLECLDFAMSIRPEFGIWAGYNAGQIQHLRRKRYRRSA